MPALRCCQQAAPGSSTCHGPWHAETYSGVCLVTSEEVQGREMDCSRQLTASTAAWKVPSTARPSRATCTSGLVGRLGMRSAPPDSFSQQPSDSSTWLRKVSPGWARQLHPTHTPDTSSNTTNRNWLRYLLQLQNIVGELEMVERWLWHGFAAVAN
jgi:hypothetical protein